MMFQPSEFAKFALVFFLASFLSRKEDVLDDFVNGLLPALLVIGLMVIPVLLEPNMGTTFILLSISVTMLFIGGGASTAFGDFRIVNNRHHAAFRAEHFLSKSAIFNVPRNAARPAKTALASHSIDD